MPSPRSTRSMFPRRAVAWPTRLAALLAVAVPAMLIMPAAAQNGTPADASPEATGEQAAATAPEAPASAITLPADMEADAITNHLRAGEFAEALEQVGPHLHGSGQLSLRLYQQGMAQLGLAEQSGEAADYLTAGISFMRVLVYFPRSRYAGYAEVELGYVHHRIGRTDIARRLYDRARPAIDPDRDAAYHARLMSLLDDLP